jgi:hypothetical protein
MEQNQILDLLITSWTRSFQQGKDDRLWLVEESIGRVTLKQVKERVRRNPQPLGEEGQGVLTFNWHQPLMFLECQDQVHSLHSARDVQPGADEICFLMAEVITSLDLLVGADEMRLSIPEVIISLELPLAADSIWDQIPLVMMPWRLMMHLPPNQTESRTMVLEKFPPEICWYLLQVRLQQLRFVLPPCHPVRAW